MNIASLVLGIVGFLVSLTIFLDLSLILCVLGIVFGIISIVRKESKGMAIAGIVLSVIGFVLCMVSASMSTTTTTTSTGITNDSGTGTKVVEVSVDKIEYETLGITKAGDYVLRVINNNEGSVCLSEVDANFKDADGNFLLSSQAVHNYIVIPGNSYTIIYFNGYDNDFSKYPNVEFKSELADMLDFVAYSGIEITSINTGKQIAVTAKNNTGKTLSNVQVLAVYYDDGVVVGVEDGYTFNTIADGESAYINVDYSKDSKYDDVSFDKYEVYYINADYE